MTWNAASPDGTISVKANRTQMNANNQYIQTTMGNSVVGTNTVTTRDHFWDVGTTEDGRHRFIQSPAFTVGGLPTDPVVGTGMDGVGYYKTKTAAESTAQQDVQPFFRNTTQIMQIPGMRAILVFNQTGGVYTTVYKHNIANLTVNGAGLYTVTFTDALPSINYLVLGGALRNSSTAQDELLFEVQASTDITTTKSTTFLKFMTKSDGGNLHAPRQCWFCIFGG